MFLSMKISTFAFLALLVCSKAKSVPEGRYQFGDSYIDDIKLSYENGVWQCDTITCPLGVFGCTITRQNDSRNPLQLITANTCYLENNDIVKSVSNIQPIPANKTVHIDINSFVDAETVYMNRYRMSEPGKIEQTVRGVIAPEDWVNVQEQTRNMIKNLES